MSFFSDDQIAKLAQLSKDAGETRDLQIFVGKILKFLRNSGFRAARYYECATNRPENDALLILSGQDSSDSLVSLGYEIRFKTSTLGMAEDHGSVATGSTRSTNQKWVADLGLTDNACWVDVPVRSRERLVGLLAADWRAPEVSLSTSARAILSMLGNLIASVSESLSAADADRIESAFTTALRKNADTVDAMLTIVADELVETMNFGVVAVFERSRGGSRLRKVRESIHQGIGRDIPQFDEEYKPGEYLTGLAWHKPEARHVVDFSALIANKKHEVETRSFDRHTTLLGRLKSVLYSKVESSEPRYLVRIMNRVDSPLPIMVAHRLVVDRLTASLANHIDDAVAKRRLDGVVRIARVAAKNITKPNQVIAQARTALRSEGFEDLLVLARRRDQDAGTAWFDAAGGFKPKPDEIVDWSDPAFRALLTEHLHATPLSELQKGTSHSLFGSLAGQGYQTLLSKAVEASEISVIMALLLKEPMAGQQHLNAIPQPTSQLIDTYGAVVGSSIEGHDSHVTAEGSRRFMGRIGHEVRAPALDSVQAALYGLAVAKRGVRHIPDAATAREIDAQLDEAVVTVNRKSTEIDRMMDFAKLAALEEVGNVPFDFQVLDLGILLHEIVSSLRSQHELVCVDQDGNVRECTVAPNKAIQSLGTVTGDKSYLRVVFSHLFRNAAKYSLPRGPGRPIEIKLTGIPQPNVAIVQISNWGVGIEQEEFETIFQPHVRGTAHDKRKAIGGLGLGLYVSRLLVRAHSGSVLCLHSKPTLGDAARTAAFEGYETCFEVRLPRSNRVGVKSIELGRRAP